MAEDLTGFAKKEGHSFVEMLNRLIYYQSCRLEGYKNAQEQFNFSVALNNVFSEARSLSYISREYLKRLIRLYGKEPDNVKIINQLYFSIAGGDARQDAEIRLRRMIRQFKGDEIEMQFAYEKALKIACIPAFMSEILTLQKAKLQEQSERVSNLQLQNSNRARINLESRLAV